MNCFPSCLELIRYHSTRLCHSSLGTAARTAHVTVWNGLPQDLRNGLLLSPGWGVTLSGIPRRIVCLILLASLVSFNEEIDRVLAFIFLSLRPVSTCHRNDRLSASGSNELNASSSSVQFRPDYVIAMDKEWILGGQRWGGPADQIGVILKPY
ncbi:hypothetical protein RRG08_067296 [Elysia crispata]|uniref:Uncharacterized protein n=1 Tax=Elysia crispata TaxID=231223 RepID=A0AAE0Z9X4_9GAST|nr:hypothetical protein RRG08_067296 [Elysia crispata]